VYVATGFSGNGFTFGTLAAVMACDYVLGRTSSWTDIFAISRSESLHAIPHELRRETGSDSQDSDSQIAQSLR
jgi:hypothetical protein